MQCPVSCIQIWWQVEETLEKFTYVLLFSSVYNKSLVIFQLLQQCYEGQWEYNCKVLRNALNEGLIFCYHVDYQLPQ